MRSLRLFLDANIVVSAALRDFFLTCAEQQLVDVRWSLEVMDESRRALERRLGLSPDQIDHLMHEIEGAFPFSTVSPGDYKPLGLPDMNDEHVLAAAIAGECDVLVTDNTRDFPDQLVPAGADLVVLTGDEAIGLIVPTYPGMIEGVVGRITGRMKNPARSPRQYVDELQLHAPLGASVIGALLGFDDHRARHVEALTAMSDDGAAAPVRALVDALRTGHSEALAGLVADDLYARLGAELDEPNRTLFELLAEELRGVVASPGEWVYGTTFRPVGAGVEVVRLARSGDQVIFENEPLADEYYDFEVQMMDTGQWTIIGFGYTNPGS